MHKPTEMRESVLVREITSHGLLCLAKDVAR